MPTMAQLRNRYAGEAVTTASPAKLLTMLYDRLVKDLQVAEQAVVVKDVPGAHAALIHAQEIIRELAATLDTKVWPEGEALLALYQYCLDQLVLANVHKQAQYIQNTRAVIEPMREAWHIAAGSAAA